MNDQILLRVYQAVIAKKEHYENFTLITDELVESVLRDVVERDGQFFDKNGTPIENLPGYAARYAEWRLLDAERQRQRLRQRYVAQQRTDAANDVSDAVLARGTMPSVMRGDDGGGMPPGRAADLRAVIKKLEDGECYEDLGVLLRKAQRIGHVLRMVLVEEKSYELVAKKLGISKGTVAGDVVLGKRYLRTVARKLERIHDGDRS